MQISDMTYQFHKTKEQTSKKPRSKPARNQGASQQETKEQPPRLEAELAVPHASLFLCQALESHVEVACYCWNQRKIVSVSKHTVPQKSPK